MSWSYDPTQLQDSPLMQVRLMLGDTDEDDPLMQDEEIQFYIDASGSAEGAVIKCIDTALARIAAIPEYKLGPYQESMGNRITFLNGLRKQLEDGATLYNAPLSEGPTTKPIFGYDMMSALCDHTMGGGQGSE